MVGHASLLKRPPKNYLVDWLRKTLAMPNSGKCTRICCHLLKTKTTQTRKISLKQLRTCKRPLLLSCNPIRTGIKQHQTFLVGCYFPSNMPIVSPIVCSSLIYRNRNDVVQCVIKCVHFHFSHQVALKCPLLRSTRANAFNKCLLPKWPLNRWFRKLR